MAANPISVILWKWQRPGYRSTFTAQHVNVFARMLARHTTRPYRLKCITDAGEGIDPSVEVVPIWPDPVPSYGNSYQPNCFRRLKAFGPGMAKVLGARWIWFDLDCIICGNVDHILDDRSEFRIWRPDGGRSLCNGSMVAHKAGTRTSLWTGFDPAAIGGIDEFRTRTDHLGSDQAWIATHLTEEDAFFTGRDGVYAFRSVRNPARERWVAKQAKQRFFPGTPASQRAKIRDIARRERLANRREQKPEDRLDTRLPENACVVFFPGHHHPWDDGIRAVYPWLEEHWR